MFTVSELIEELKYIESIGMGRRYVKNVDESCVIILEKEKCEKTHQF